MQAYASISADLGRKTDALELYRQVLAGREAKLGPKHQSVLDTVDALASYIVRLDSTRRPRIITAEHPTVSGSCLRHHIPTFS